MIDTRAGPLRPSDVVDMMTSMVPLLVLGACVAACDPVASDRSSERAAPHEVVSPTPAGTRAAKPRSSDTSGVPAPSAIATTLAAVRDQGERVEIELAFERRLPGGDIPPPTLQVGEEVVRASFHPGGALDRLVFRVPQAQFERMQDGAAMTVSTRGVVSTPVLLDKRGMVSP